MSISELQTRMLLSSRSENQSDVCADALLNKLLGNRPSLLADLSKTGESDVPLTDYDGIADKKVSCCRIWYLLTLASIPGRSIAKLVQGQF